MRTTAQWGFFLCVCVFTPLLEQAAYTLPPSIIWLLVHSAYALRLATEWSLVSGGPGFPGKGQGLRSQKRLYRTYRRSSPQTTDPSGGPRGSAPGGHLCCGLMGITRYFSRSSRVNVATLHPLAVVLQPEASDPTHTDPTLVFFIRRSVLEIPLLVVSRDESEWRVTDVTRLLWIPHDHQSFLALTIL